jgi:DNA polymerase III delta subunit
MLYVFHGTDTASAVTKATSLVSSLRTKRPDASYVHVEAGQWSPSIIEEHIGGQGLFSNKYIIFLDRVTENAEAKESFAGFVSVMAESTNIFIVLEGKLGAELKKAFEKSAEKMIEVSEKLKVESGKSKKTEEFNIFALADAVGARDTFKAWSVYRQAVDAGNEPESIIGTLFWQVKSMKLAANAKSAGESGLSPFVFSKAKKATGNYSEGELNSLTEKLISVYHDAHRGVCDAELAVERVMLDLKK